MLCLERERRLSSNSPSSFPVLWVILGVNIALFFTNFWRMKIYICLELFLHDTGICFTMLPSKKCNFVLMWNRMWNATSKFNGKQVRVCQGGYIAELCSKVFDAESHFAYFSYFAHACETRKTLYQFSSNLKCENYNVL